MTANDFRELALGIDDAEEGAHMGAADFRVGGRIFATLAHEHLGFGNLMLSPELQQSLIAEAPGVFLPVSGGWGDRARRISACRRRPRSSCSKGSGSPGICESRRTASQEGERRTVGGLRRTDECDLFGTPSTSLWTGAAIIAREYPRTKSYIVTRSRTSSGPMPSSSDG
jgi:hypothetical protein